VNQFFGRTLLKLAGNVHNGKNGIPLFCLIFKMNTNDDICINRFFSFFNSAHFSWFKVGQIFTLHSFEHLEFRSVEISKLPCTVSELQAFIFLYF
jgi:hypothetical protein